MRQARWPRTASRLSWIGSLLEPHFQCSICSPAEAVLQVLRSRLTGSDLDRIQGGKLGGTLRQPSHSSRA